MDEDLYKEIYAEISEKTTKLLNNYLYDKDKSYQAGMALLMLSMKMLMFSGVTREALPQLYKGIDETFDSVCKDFEKVDLNLKD